MIPWIDTHCHLDVVEFDNDRPEMLQRADIAGIKTHIVPGVQASTWLNLQKLAHQYQWAYALGIHPLYVNIASPEDLTFLKTRLELSLNDSRCVAVGEIGLDRWDGHPDIDCQKKYLQAQLTLAQEYELAVILHCRQCSDELYSIVKRAKVVGGIVHAFNGSMVQAQRWLDLGFKLGFGGAVTYEGSRRIRRLITELPDDGFVLETDSPDMPPTWLRKNNNPPLRNEPSEMIRIAQIIADLRNTSLENLRQINYQNACTALPRLATLLAS